MSARVDRLAALTGAGTCLLLVVPGNLLFGLTPRLTALAAAFGLACLGLYALSRRGHQLHGALPGLLVAVLNAAWFLGGGSHGSVVMWFPTAALLLAILFRGRTQAIALALLVADGLLLYWADARHPALIVPASSADERFYDLVSGFVLSLLTCVLLVRGVLAAYLQEQQRLRETNQALERSLAEVKTLRTLLPVCAWCQRIRDDAGRWQPMKTYLEERTRVTHGICPECLERHFEAGGAAPAPPAGSSRA